MKTVVDVVDELIVLIKADETLWNSDETVRNQPSYTGFRDIHNNRVFDNIDLTELSFPMLAVDLAPTLVEKLSDGSGSPYACQIVLQVYSLLGTNDSEISISRNVSIKKLYAVLDVCNACPVKDKIEMSEDILGSNRVTWSACVIEKSL